MNFLFIGEADSIRYSEELAYYSKSDLGNIFEFIYYTITNPETGRPDFFQPLVTYTVSRFSNSPIFLFTVFAIIYGYFYSRNIWSILEFINQKIKPVAWIFFLLFMFIVSFDGINGFRFWTATHVFLFGVIQFVLKNKRLYGCLFLFFSYLIHDTYIISCLIFFMFLIVKNYPRIVLFIYFSSFFVTSVAPNLVIDAMDNSPVIVRDRKGYVDEQYIADEAASFEATNWYVRYKYTLMEILIISTTTWILLFKKETLDKNSNLSKLMVLGFLFLIFTNLVGHLPSMARFYYPGFHATLAFLFLYFQTNQIVRSPEWFKVLVIFIGIYSIILKIWEGANSYSLAALISNPFTFWIFESEESLASTIKSIF
jgi:hypothetical protein